MLPIEDRMTAQEWRATAGLASVFAMRMLGLFMVLPVLTLHAEQYSGYRVALAGLAIGAYGLTQAAFQIPFGMASDRIGRKPVIVAGLLIFALGSVIAARADSMWGLIFGRGLQGAGAVAGAVLALTADLTREESRTKAMAVIGMSIGAAFALALVIGPLVSARLGLPGIFWLTAGLALAGIATVVFAVPTPPQARRHRDTQAVPSRLWPVFKNPELARLFAGISILHLVLMMLFLAVPTLLRDGAGLATGSHGPVYLLVLGVSAAIMVPMLILGERRGIVRSLFVGAIGVLGLSVAALGFVPLQLAPIVLVMVAFFAAFNFLEATLPSLVSRHAPPEEKGTALGAYATAQFLGAFMGGLLGGLLLEHLGLVALCLSGAALSGVWLALALGMTNPSRLSARVLRLGALSQDQASRAASRLAEIQGVAEAVVIAEDGIAYLKVDRSTLDERALRAFSAAKA